MKRIFFAFILFLFFSAANSQVKIGTNPSSINPFSLLELESNQKGLLLPRVATATDLAVMSGAPEGMIVYFIPDGSLYIKQSSSWVKVTGNWATAGTHIYNENSGNVGIGNNNPSHGKLEVSSFVGNVAGMFGNGTNSGISLNGGFPEVGFNYYFNGSNKAIAPGYAGVMGLNPFNGDLYIGNFNNNQAPTPFTDIPGYTDRMILKQNGNLGIGLSPTEKLDVSGNIKLNGEINRPPSGSANLLPFAYGKIKNDGVILGGTGNFSVTKTGTGLYEITLTGEPNVYSNQSFYMVQVTVESSSIMVASVDFKVNNNIQVRTAEPRVNYSNFACNNCSETQVFSYINSFIASVNTDNWFSFLIYKL
jgi:hypothetical protein